MKFNFADIPVNVIDGACKYPLIASCSCSLIAGVALSWFIVYDTRVFAAAGLLLLAGLVTAYFVGKPKK
jgi:hypothetical protein